jgi:glycosyltransferase involved in cell wall biosynthesis
MTKLLYFGNKTASYKASKSMLETLEPLFGEFATVRSASSQKNQFLRLASMVFLFLRFFRTADFVLIDVYSTRAYMYTATIGRLAQITGKKYILILHGGNLPHRFEQKEASMRKLFSRAHAVVAPSNYLKQFFDSKGIPTHFIPNIIELSNYPYFERSHFQPSFLALRGFDKPYNPLMTVKAIELVRNKYPNVKLYFVGATTETEYPAITAYIKSHQLEEQIEIVPKMPKAQWIEFSKKADFMLTNPVIDNTPVSVIEGMALGLVIVSTEVGGVPYLVNDGEDARLVPTNDPERMATVLCELLENEDLCKNLSKNGRRKAQSFDWEVVKLEWKKLITKETSHV